MNNDDDKELARLLAEDLDKYFPIVVERYSWRLQRFSHRYVGNHVDEDMVQQTMLKVYSRFKGASATEVGRQWLRSLELRSYLFAVARNECFDHLNRKQQGNFISSLDYDDNIQSTTPFVDPWKLIEMRIDVSEVIHSFSERDRLIVYLHFMEGWTYPKIALRLNMRVSAIKSVIFRARKELHKFLDDFPFGRER